MLRLLITATILSRVLSCTLAAAVEIKSIDASHNRTLDSIEFAVTDYVKARGILLDNQLQLDFPGATVSREVPIALSANSRRVVSLEVEQVNGAARIIINLKKDVDYEVINIFGRNRTVVELYDYVDYTAQLMAAWEQANLKKAGDKLKPYKYEPQYGADQSLRGKTIILDPGHGGSDPGAFARGGRPEKELTLRTARLLAERLSRLGATVYLTRNDDRRYNLKDIVNYANRSGADIFICIHYNSSRKPRTAGTETYYYNPYSRRLARNIHISLIGELRRPDRGLRRAMFYTVHHTRMPAVLIEPLFLSNDQEERLAWSTDFQDQLVRALVKGVKQYF